MAEKKWFAAVNPRYNSVSVVNLSRRELDEQFPAAEGFEIRRVGCWQEAAEFCIQKGMTPPELPMRKRGRPPKGSLPLTASRDDRVESGSDEAEDPATSGDASPRKSPRISQEPLLNAGELSSAIADSFRSSSRAPKLKSKAILGYCGDILNSLRRHEDAWPFLKPVNPILDGAPDYYEVVRRPMDLSKIHAKMSRAEYSSHEEFIADVKIVFSNAKLYNPPDNVVYEMATSLQALFEEKLRGLRKFIKEVEEDGIAANTRASRFGSGEVVGMSYVTLPPTIPHRILSFEEKVILTRKINSLEPSELHTVVHIISQTMPNVTKMTEQGQSVEVDVDLLPNDTLLLLKDLIHRLELAKRRLAAEQPVKFSIRDPPGSEDSLSSTSANSVAYTPITPSPSSSSLEEGDSDVNVLDEDSESSMSPEQLEKEIQSFLADPSEVPMHAVC